MPCIFLLSSCSPHAQVGEQARPFQCSPTAHFMIHFLLRGSTHSCTTLPAPRVLLLCSGITVGTTSLVPLWSAQWPWKSRYYSLAFTSSAQLLPLMNAISKTKVPQLATQGLRDEKGRAELDARKTLRVKGLTVLHMKKLLCKDGFKDMRNRTWLTVTSPIQVGLLVE